MSRPSNGASVSVFQMRMPQRHTFNACREERCFTPIVIATVMQALSCSVLEANVVLGNEVHEFRRGVDYNAVRIDAALVVHPATLRVQITRTRVRPFGVNASEVETIRQSEAVAVSAT
jgi:hypothetical protein